MADLENGPHWTDVHEAHDMEDPYPQDEPRDELDYPHNQPLEP